MKIGNSLFNFALIGLCALTMAPRLSAQTFTVNPTSIALSAPASSTSPSSQVLTVSVAGGGGQVLSLSAASPPTNSWLRVVVSTVSACQSPVINCPISNPPSSVSVTVQANPTGLAQGTYSGQVTLTLTGSPSPPNIIVPVTFTVGSGSGGSGSLLTASPTSLTFAALPGAIAQSQNVAISNSGGSVSYTVTSNVNWLSTNLGSNQGVSPGNLTVTASAASLPASVSSYVGTLTLTPTGGGQTTTVQVAFNVSTTQQFQISPSSLTFSYITGSGNATPQNLTVGVTTGSAIAYTVTANYGLGPTNWLQTNPVSGGTTGTLISVTPLASSLGIGTYTATLSFSASGLTTASIPVTLTVSSPPTFVVSPTPILISVQPNTSATRTLSINTSNSAVVSYSVTPTYQSPAVPAVNWLTVSPSNGSTPASVTIGVNPSNLNVGTYTALLTINSSTPGVTQTTVVVSMLVTTSQIVTTSTNSLSFNFVGGGSTPNSQFVSLGLTPSTPIQTATVVGVPEVVGQNWLTATLSSPSGSQITGNAAAIVTVNPSGLANGTYTGKVQINISNAGGPVANTLVEIPVTLTVSGVIGGGGGVGGGTTTVLLSQSQINFNTLQNATSDQTLTLTSNTTTQVPYFLSTTTPWITILNGSGTTPGTPVIIRANTTGLGQGTYSGQIALSATGASNNGTVIQVNLTVSNTNQLQTSPSGFTFNHTIGSGFPNAQPLQISSSTGSALQVGTSVTTNSGGAWLSVSPSSVSTPGNILISINSGVLQTLIAGSYTGNIALTTTGALNSTVNVPVTLNVSGTGVGGGGTGADTLVLGPNPINFFTSIGGTPPGQLLDITTQSGNPLNYSLAFTTVTGGSWLSVGSSGGVTPAQALVNASSSALAGGTYSGTITITAPGAINSGVTVPVNLIVSNQTNIVAAPAGVVFTFPLGSSQTLLQRTINLSTTNGTIVPISVTTDSQTGRLTVSTNSSTTPAVITVSVNPVGLTAGVYPGTVFVNSSGASNSPLNLPITLIVTGGTGGGTAQLALNPVSLNFFGQPNGTPPQQRTVQVTSTGSAISYSVSTNQAWLQAAPSSGTTPGAITVGVNPSGLGAGTYTGNVTVVGGASTVNLAVTFEVTNNPLLQLSQQFVTYNYQTGQALPSPRPILVTTSNGSSLTATVTVTTSSGGNWLLASPASLQTPGAFALSLANNIVSTLAVGTYTGTVTVNAPGAANANATINVTLNVSASPLLTMSTTPLTFNAQFNGNQPPAQARQITATSGALSVTVSTSTTTGTWLSANINSNTTPATLTISATPFNLGTGIYTGSVTVTSGSSASALVIPVTLNISSLPLISVDKSELIFGSGGNSGTQPQTIQISSSSTNFNYSVQASVTNSPTNWLSVGNVTGVTPSSMVVNVNPALLGDGTYFGTIVISSPGAGNTPLVIPVTLTVNQATALQVNPSSLSFTQVQGSVPPAQLPIQVTSQLPTSFSVTSAVQSPVGGNWLSVNPSGGLTNGFLQASINNSASSLPVGTYTGTITVFGANSPNSIPITVTLNVISSATLQVSPISLSFTGRAGQPNPAAQLVQLTSSNAATQLTYNITSDAVWLTGTPVSGNTPASLSVAVNLAALPAGVFSGTGRLTVTPTGAAGIASGQPVVIIVNLQVDQTPLPNITGFANAATFQPGSLAPGMIISLVGTNLGPTQAVNGQVVGGRFTTALMGVRVLFDGIPAPILYASATQINAVVPYSLAGRASSRMSVEYNNVVSTTIEPRLVDTAPGVFTADGRQAAMINENGTFNSASNPAPTGSIVVIYVTGEGSTSPAGVDGEVIGSTLKRPIGTVRVRVGGIEVPAADIFYAGSAPTLVSGLMQINFRLPANTPTGISTQVEVFVGSGQSQPGVTMSVR